MTYQKGSWKKVEVKLRKAKEEYFFGDAHNGLVFD